MPRMPAHARPRPAASLPLALILACPAPGDETVTATATSTTEPTTGGNAELPTTTTAATTTDTTTTDEPPVDDGRGFFVAGRMGDEAFILHVSPSTGAVEPFGPALPFAADELSHPAVVARPDHSRVVVDCYLEPEVPLATLLVGDGNSWQLVTKYNENGLGGHDLAPDASLFYFDVVADPDAIPTFQAKVITLDGETVFTGPPLDADARYYNFTFGPDGAYFTFRDPARGPVLRTLDGDEHELPLDTLHSKFATSLILTDYDVLQWLDLEAQPIDVPGFSAIDDDASTLGYQIVGDQLSLFGDRVVTPLQKVPPGMSAADVFGHYDGLVLGRPTPNADLSTIGPDGAVLAGFTPEPTTNDPGPLIELHSWLYPAAACPDCATPSVALVVSNEVIDDFDGYLFDRSVQLWRLDASGGSASQSTVRPWTEGDVYPHQFLYSADGAFLAWVEGGQLWRLDVAAGVAAPIDSPYTLIEP